jgi:signal transduction histidine kinase
VADLLPSEGKELVINTSKGFLWVLDRDFQPLSRFEKKSRFWHSPMFPWEPAPGVELLMHAFGSGYPLQFTKAPPPPLNRALIFGVISALLIFVMGFLLRKLLRGKQGDPVVLREVRLHLLEDLELSNHGAIAPLKCVRRLIWHMNAMTSGLGDNASIEPRLRETWTECVDISLPHLTGILDRARLAGLAGANVDFADRSMGRVRELLDELKNENFQESCFEIVSAKLNTETVKADDALQDLRQEVARFFHSDLPATVTRVLRANSMAIEESGVAVQTGFLAQMAAGSGDTLTQRANPVVVCLIDPKELDFVLDNLVGNAVRAMKDSASRNLAVTWTTTDGMVSVDVRDSGHGIPDELRSKIMDTKFSTREGGGQGLPKSRTILRKYGGGLMILDTAPGHGTTFRLTLPAAM